VLSPIIDKLPVSYDMENKIIKPRKVVCSLILSICPGLGHQYAGHLYRGIIHYVTLIILAWVCAAAFMFVDSKYLSVAIVLVPFIYAVVVALDAVYCAIKQPLEYRLKWYNRIWIYLAVFAFLFVTVNPMLDMLIGENIVRAYLVVTQSMSPTLLEHDLVAINKLADPERSDIVLIGYDNDLNDTYISQVINDQTLRRVISVPGDTVEVRGKKIIVNKRELYEPYVSYGEVPSPNAYIDDDYTWGPEVVPEDSYFVLSDAREYSFDSRVVGFINKDKVNGVASKIFWSWNFDENRIKWERVSMSID
jgi:signal peptidase I